MKKIIIAMMLALPMLASAQKFGHINTQELFAQMPEVAKVKLQMDTIQAQYENQLASMNEEFQKKFQDYQAQEATMADAVKQIRQQELQEMQQRIQLFYQTAEQDIQKKQQELLMPVHERMAKAIKAVGEREAYTYIFDSAAMVHITLTSLDVANMSNLETLQCYSTKLTSLSLTNKTKLATLSCYNIPTMTTLTVTGTPLTTLNMAGNTGLTTLNCYSNASLTGFTTLSACTNLVTLNCYSNNFTTLTVPSALTKLQTLKCYNNKLTSLSVYGCTALKTIECYKNKITGSGMTTLVNSLPTRTSSAKGTLRAIYNSGESNTMTTAQITTARNKYWTPYKYNGSSWIEMTSIEDKIWMDNATGDPGVYVNLPVTLQNSETVTGIEFDVYYPTGFTALASKGPRLAEGSTVANSTTSGYRHVTIANTSTNVVVEESGSGVICYVRVKAPATAGGSYEISLRNIKVVLASGTKTLSNCTATFTVNNTTGDVNGDGQVNIGDVTDLIDYLMSGNASGINVAAADVNGDGGVNITDVTDLIDLLLTK